MDPSKPAKQANLKSISLAGLLAQDPDDTRDLVEACKTHGFFYLDFRHDSTREILELVDELAAIGKSTFALPLEEKEEYSTEKYLPSRLLGYVSCDTVREKGKRTPLNMRILATSEPAAPSDPFQGEETDMRVSRYDWLRWTRKAHRASAVLIPRKTLSWMLTVLAKIHNNGIFGEDAMIVPQVIHDSLPLFEKFLSQVHDYTDCILSLLSKALQLPSDLRDCHRKGRPSAANMAMLKYLPWGSSEDRIGNMAHTDMGTLTVVFSKSDGLQAMLPGYDDWSFIPPRSGHAVVNVGDSLRFLSRGVLASSLHRVVPPPDSAGQDKFSVIYFLRPEFGVKFTTHDGKEISSAEWHNQKYALFREESLDAKRHGAILTGRQEYLGSTDE
ncbi:hypothetical protein E4U43_002008 [Claviceps pusilla]|uniref:Fe2OG dioxygenase domain-containing protein n=1 Tax=Claviceps pusilla TaxID=123648 RepID=A0A9P7SYT8_9HYPO|nr:hypothetical protein E4U43_002008 [Claviceps pusilla]